MDVKEMDDKTVQKIKEAGVIIFGSSRWTKFNQTKEKEIVLDEIVAQYEKDIWAVAQETLPIKSISNIPKLKPRKESDAKKENKHNQNLVIKAILSIANAIKLNKITNKIKDLYTKIKGNKYAPQTAQSTEYLKDLKEELYQTIKELRSESENITKEEDHGTIQKRVNEIHTLRISNPGKFFARARPDSVFSSQQL
eukprot:Phypoly_transcript_14826.p1 GENE.Phypoly_transcript_14826~~Phypoly_transcript_14826.p1  ORF type:complete len:196 (+),score=27.50 Phypoly_transcript_14826:206-793(+)